VAAPVDALASDLQVGELPSGDAPSAEVLSADADAKKTDTVWYYEDALADAAAPIAPDAQAFADTAADPGAPRQQGDSSARTPRIADTSAGGGRNVASGTVATAVASPADSGCRGAPVAGANSAAAAAAALALLAVLRRRRAKG
jgi:hypothetical protein